MGKGGGEGGGCPSIRNRKQKNFGRGCASPINENKIQKNLGGRGGRGGLGFKVCDSLTDTKNMMKVTICDN